MQKLKIFISSVQKEFATERERLFSYLQTDALLSDFFEPVLFEKLPSGSQAPNKVYLNEVAQSQIYLVLLGTQYGYEDANGMSPTELEYEHSKVHHIPGFAYIKGENTLERNTKEKRFISKIQKELSYKRFDNIEQLIALVYASLISFLKHKGLIQRTSFDEALHPTAGISDIDPAKVDNFLGLANYKRGFPIRQGSSVEKVLTHLNMLNGGKLCNSALLAFGKNPQQFFATAVTKCAHFHGYIVEKPIPDHKVFGGDVFQQVDEAVDFVLSKIGVSVGLRNDSTQSPIKYEIPRPVVTEAIVNAVAHRDYNSNGSVQVMLFVDRLEIFNPGRLTDELSMVKLKTDHGSYPTNPKLAEPMYQAGYIERFGTGTGEIIRLTVETGLQEPEFDFEEGFKVIIWRPTTTTAQATGEVTGEVTGEATGEVTGEATGEATGEVTGEVTEAIRRVVLVLYDEMKRIEIQEALQLRHQESFRDLYLIPAMDEGFVEMTIPGKPSSPNQRYRLTPKGVEFKKKIKHSN